MNSIELAKAHIATAEMLLKQGQYQMAKIELLTASRCCVQAATAANVTQYIPVAGFGEFETKLVEKAVESARGAS